MKKVTVFIGSARKGGTYKAAKEFEGELKKHCEAEVEYVFLSKGIEACKGCLNCFNKGEECCPIKDSRDELIEKIEQSDGVVFATPNYAFHVSGIMKNFIDRLAFTIHRPMFFGKAFTSIVAQGIMGGKPIVKYLTSAGENMGFTAKKGCLVRTIDPLPEKDGIKNTKAIKRAAIKYAKTLNKKSIPMPSLYRLVIFRLTRSGIMEFEPEMKDYRHFKEMGWFESDYYYKIDLGIIRKAIGGLSDALGRWMAKA